MDESLPTLNFDFGQPDALTRLLQAAEEALSIHGRPQRQMLDELDALFKNRGRDTTVYQVLRIIRRYVRVYPESFEDMVQVLRRFPGDASALGRALELIPGVQPPKRVWDTLEVLQKENAEESLIQAFWAEILDCLEGGEEDYWMYVGICMKYRYQIRGLPPGYWEKPKSKVLVPYRDRPRSITTHVS